MSRKVLGKGLRALIPEPETGGLADGDPGIASRGAATNVLVSLGSTPPAESGARMATLPQRVRETLKHLPIEAILPNQNQPRTDWDPSSLAELARSIRENGLLEPIVVRPRGDRFELVAGERRWRACQLSGWIEIPAIVRSFEDHESLEAALVENTQRSDLNPVDEARAYRTLAEKFGLTHEEIALKVGKDRSTVSNLLRVLRLPQSVLDLVSRGTLTVGHVKILLGLPENQVLAAADRIISDGWSVRQVEEWAAEVAAIGGRRRKARRTRRGVPNPENIQRIEQDLRRRFATDARIRFTRKGGRVEIRFHDEEDLSRLLDLWGIVVA